jgi:hypothetical protein
MHLHAALFQGEVGWEVAQWIPHLRFLKNWHKPKRFTVECRKGFGDLYDFADDVRERGIDPKLRPDMLFAYRGKINRPVRSPFSTPADRVVAAETYACVPDANGVPEIHAKRQNRITPYGTSEPQSQKTKLVVHARKIDRHTDRNWGHWPDLVQALPMDFDTVVWTGSKADYFPPPYVRTKTAHTHVDVRGKPIGVQLEHMRSAAFCLGASSGTMHVAQHAGAPVAIWSGNPGKDKPRWTKSWNPHGTKVRWIDGGWQPSLDDVLRTLNEWRP